MLKTSKKKVTKIGYSLEQFLAESKQRELTNRTLEKIVKTLDKIAKVQQKQQDLAVLHDFRIKRLEKKK